MKSGFVNASVGSPHWFRFPSVSSASVWLLTVHVPGLQLASTVHALHGSFEHALASMETVRKTFADLFPAPADTNPLYDVAPFFVFALMDGLALEKIVTDDPDRIRSVLDALKSLANLAIKGD